MFRFALVALILLTFAQSAECAGTVYRSPRISTGRTVSRGYTPHFPNTTTRTITQGRNNYIHPAPPKTR